MKICILTKFYPPHSTEGIPRTREIYAKGLVRAGHEVHVITSGHDGYTHEQDGVFIHEISVIRADEIKAHFEGFSGGEHANFQLSYSYRVYRKILSLTKFHDFDLIDSPLWDIEGYITKLKLPSIPMVLRLETTSRHIREINKGDAGPLSVSDKFERNFLLLGDSYVFDSWAIYEDVKRLYQFDFSNKPWRVIHHGIELDSCDSEIKLEKNNVTDVTGVSQENPLQVLYVGRLEKRKGADFLIQKVIPKVLESNQNVEFHLVGKDCSHVDGFLKENGVDYKGWCDENLSEFVGKQLHFYGYLSDEEVDAFYQRSDLIANFSRYESFGLLYLEAMRMRKTQIVFQNAAIREIMYGCDEGPIQVAIDDQDQAVNSILDIERGRSQLQSRGLVSYEHFKKYFADEFMLKNCEQFFEVCLRRQTPRVVHIMYALDKHDGVSNIAIDYYKLTKSMGFDTVLTGRFVHPELASIQLPIEDCLIRDEDIVLIHYWGFSDFLPRYHEMPGKKVLVFHNITNPYFFKSNEPGWQGTAGAYAQMKELDFVKDVATFSRFSQVPIRNYFGDSMRYHVLPPLMDAEIKRNNPCNETLLSELKKDDRKKLLFVGRIVAHKKQDELILLLHRLDQADGPQTLLYLVGNPQTEYIENLKEIATSYGLLDRIVFTGLVPEEDLVSYYRGCDLFVSMSEHEGFCIPLIDAMIYGLPVIGYAQPAVAETIGNTNAVFEKKLSNNTVEFVKRMIEDERAREQLIQKQNERVQNFSEASVRDSLKKLIDTVTNE